MTMHRAETAEMAIPLEHSAPLPEHAPCARSPRNAQIDLFRSEVLVIWFLLRQPNTPWYVRIIAGLVAAYVVSPIQLIPSFIPVIGLMDDVFVAAAGLAMIRFLAPSSVLKDARERARTALARGDNALPVAWRATAMIVALCWLAATICAFLILYRW